VHISGFLSLYDAVWLQKDRTPHNLNAALKGDKCLVPSDLSCLQFSCIAHCIADFHAPGILLFVLSFVNFPWHRDNCVSFWAHTFFCIVWYGHLSNFGQAGPGNLRNYRHRFHNYHDTLSYSLLVTEIVVTYLEVNDCSETGRSWGCRSNGRCSSVAVRRASLPRRLQSARMLLTGGKLRLSTEQAACRPYTWLPLTRMIK